MKFTYRIIFFALIGSLALIYLTYEKTFFYKIAELIICTILVIFVFIAAPLLEKSRLTKYPQVLGEVVDAFKNEYKHSDTIYVWVHFYYNEELYRIEEEYDSNSIYPKIDDKVIVYIDTKNIFDSTIINSWNGMTSKILAALFFISLIALRAFGCNK